MKPSFRPVPAVLILVLLLSVVLGGCGGSKIELEQGKINVVTSFYPLYDFAAKIGGEHVHVQSAVPTGVEPHDWAPKSRDITAIHKADLFVYQGSGFEGWIDKLLESKPGDAKVRVVEASQGLTLIQAEGGGHDPHSWLSPANAKKMAENIKNGLVEADAAHKSDYEANFKQLTDRLGQLDQHFRTALAATPRKDIVVSHDAFAYLCRDYGLMQKPIMGLAPDAEPTAQDMKSINDFVKKNNVKYIFFEELVSDKLAKTLASDAKIETLVLNPLEGLTDEETKAGDDYFSLMEKNLQNLLKALQ